MGRKYGGTWTVGRFLAVVLLALPGAGCEGWPRDPDGTLERVSGGVLRVGATESPPWIRRAPDGSASGPEAELVEAFAASIDARVEWRWGGADEHLRALEQRELDIAAIGLTARSPWKTHVGLTRPYTRDGEDERVLAVATGENATLVALDRVIESRRRGER